MRLTLRTLLALLDNVLSPADAQVLSKKVQESPKAEQLAQRIRLVLGRNDLSAAPALGEGVDDANIAAEYLDSTLSEADIAAFEHYCLSSDIRLSEVADCHKVLAEVLTRPSHVPPELRERAYRLAAGVLGTSPAWATSPGATNGGAAGLAGGSIADAPTAPLPPGSSSSHTFAPLEGPAAVTGAAAVNFTGAQTSVGKAVPSNGSAAVASSAGGTAKVRPIPPGPAKTDTIARPPVEYFGGGNSGRRVTSLVITGALLIVFMLLLVQTLRPLIRLMRDDEKVANNGDAAVGDPTADPQTQPDPASANNPPIGGTNESGVTQTTANPNASTIPPVVGTNPALPPFAAVPLTNAQATATAMPVGGVNGAPASAGPNVPAGQVAASGANVGQSGTNVAVNGLNSPGLNGASAPPSVNPAMANASPVTNESSGVPSGDAGQAKPQAFPGETALPGEVGKLVTDDSLLLQFDGIAQVWRRANREAPLASPVQLVSPTLFRNRLILNGGVDLTMLPSTSVILTNTQRPAPVIAIDFGRVVLGTTAADTILALNMHGIPGELQFSDLRSVVAINVLPQRKVGVDPQLPESSQPRIELNVLQGQVTFRLVGGDAEAIYANQRWVFEQNHPLGIEDVAAPPAWIEEPPITPTSIEHFAKLGVMERLKSSPNATEQALRDATNHRKSEVVALAAQILLETGHAEMMFGTDGMLNRANQKAYWGNDRISHGEGLQMMSHFDALQAAINRGPLPAAKVQQAIQQLNAVEAGLLYRLLWGFSDQQLADGEDEKLVQMLDHPTMSVRVLAFENLRWITNTTLGYRPDAENRRPDVLKWQARLRKGDIRWATVTTPAPTPAAAPPAEAPAPNNAAEPAVTAPPPEPGAVPLP